MDIGKRMMEKWGWKKGEGLGKDGQGVQSCLVLRKTVGSTSQGRIEQMAPLQASAPATTSSTTAAALANPAASVAGVAPASVAGVAPASVAGVAPQVGNPATLGAATAAVNAQPTMLAPSSAVQLTAEEQAAQVIQAIRDAEAAIAQVCPHPVTAPSLAVPSLNVPGPAIGEPGVEGIHSEAPAAATGEPLKRKRKTKWDGGGEVDIEDPDGHAGAVAQAQASTSAAAQLQSLVAGLPQPQQQFPQLPQQQLATMNSVMTNASLPAGRYVEIGAAPQTAATPTMATMGGMSGNMAPPAQPPVQRKRVRQFVVDDWRWSRGTDALRSYLECQLTPELFEVAKKVFGKESRFPARVADDTDVIVEVTAWSTVLLRPKGSGANLALAKSMVYDVLHPGGASLREEALIQHDKDAEAALEDASGVTEISKQYEEGVVRKKKKLQHVGLGAEAEVTTEPAKTSTRELVLPTNEDVSLIKKHHDNIRIATGIVPVIKDATLMLIGPDKALQKAEQLIETLINTGQWVAFSESFVPSEGLREQRREVDGPSEQILIKIAEGSCTQLIEKHLKVMERAAEADKLKLTSKAVAGKRSLMVEGSKRAHERVKLMVKELAEKGESPMLTKALKAPYAPPPVTRHEKVEVVLPNKEAGKSSANGRIEGAAVLNSDPMMAELAELAGSASTCNNPGLGPGPAMRHLPAPKLAPGTVVPKKSSIASADDLFAGLPPPEPTAESQNAQDQKQQAELAALAATADRELLGLQPAGITE